MDLCSATGMHAGFDARMYTIRGTDGPHPAVYGCRSIRSSLCGSAERSTMALYRHHCRYSVHHVTGDVTDAGQLTRIMASFGIARGFLHPCDSSLQPSCSGSPHPAHITSSQSPPSLPSPITASTFHSRLKTHLFHKSFPP